MFGDFPAMCKMSIGNSETMHENEISDVEITDLLSRFQRGQQEKVGAA